MAAKGIRPSGPGKADGPGKPSDTPKAAASGNGTGAAKALGSKPAPGLQKAPGFDKPAAKTAGGSAKTAASAKRRSQPIPEAVTNRMARRIAVAMGVPSLLGMASFVVSYLLVSRGILDIPPAITLVTSGGFFLLGLVGLSYGLFSASWESQPGSLLGFEQIGVNISRLKQSLKQPPAAS
jgi:hypothetical protein